MEVRNFSGKRMTRRRFIISTGGFSMGAILSPYLGKTDVLNEDWTIKPYGPASKYKSNLYCKNCGKPVSQYSSKCRECGKRTKDLRFLWGRFFGIIVASFLFNNLRTNIDNEKSSRIKEETIGILFRIQIAQQEQIDTMKQPEEQKMIFSHGEEGTKKQPVKRNGSKVGRNAPCPCGSGKKYKKCCGA